MRGIKLIFKKYYNFAKNYWISPPVAVLAVVVVALFTGGIVLYYCSRLNFPVAQMPYVVPRFRKPSDAAEEKKFIPQPFTMKELKNRGCVADGILSGYGGDTNSATALINRSECIYLHRALETWAATPDFEKAKEVMNKINKPRIVYGMFIAEALKKNADYYFPDEDRNFKFSDMCRGHTYNRWGEHTCIPSFEKEEYRDYIKTITRQAMDLGIQSFLFGQIYLQETSDDRDHSHIYEIVDDMRKYAREKHMQIVIGAQTNSMTTEKYLKLFDYIEGGVGLDNNGNIEDGPCLSWRGSCWALLWNEKYASRANNVFLHLDWSGIIDDDMSTFARMDKDTRSRTLKKLYTYFTSKNMGFMMPYTATINKTNNGCYGPKKRFYSASNKYRCKDEDAIRNIFLGK